MHRNRTLALRLGQVARLQSLKATASRARLADAQAARAGAEIALAGCERELETGARALDALLASETLDFDRWRIGRVLLGELAGARESNAAELALHESEEGERREEFHRERACEKRTEAMHRRIERKLGDKRDEAAILEANGLAVVRKMRIRS